MSTYSDQVQEFHNRMDDMKQEYSKTIAGLCILDSLPLASDECPSVDVFIRFTHGTEIITLTQKRTGRQYALFVSRNRDYWDLCSPSGAAVADSTRKAPRCLTNLCDMVAEVIREVREITDGYDRAVPGSWSTR